MERSVGTSGVNASVRRILSVIVATLLAALSSGCVTQSAGFSYGAGRRNSLQLWKSDVNEISFENNVTVYFPKELETQARRLGELFTKQLSYLREETGFQLAGQQNNLYIERRDHVDWEDHRATVWSHFAESERLSGNVLYVENEDESCETIVAKNGGFPVLHVHEVVETSLILSGPVPNDWRRKTRQGEWENVNHYTRWFREGFSDYAGFLAHQLTISSLEFEEGAYSLRVWERNLGREPFSRLEMLGKDLFNWTQFTEQPTDRGLNWNDYYSAAFGLFLVIEDRFGRDAIKSIILEVNRMERAEGSDLIELTSRALNTDVVTLVEDFRFPQTGLLMVSPWGHGEMAYPVPGREGVFVMSVEPDTAGARAGIRERDLVVAVNGKPVATTLYFELTLYELMDEPSVTISLVRQGVGKLDKEMAIEYADDTQRSEDE